VLNTKTKGGLISAMKSKHKDYEVLAKEQSDRITAEMLRAGGFTVPDTLLVPPVLADNAREIIQAEAAKAMGMDYTGLLKKSGFDTTTEPMDPLQAVIDGEVAKLNGGVKVPEVDFTGHSATASYRAGLGYTGNMTGSTA